MEQVRTPDQALAALGASPCGARLLAALDDEPGWLVGGAVRDLLLGRRPRELDVVVEGEPARLAARLGEVVAAHDRFGTMTVRDGDCTFDIVRARDEGYAAPGALPDVRPGTLEQDLARRDFTVNAIALRPAPTPGRTDPRGLTAESSSTVLARPVARRAEVRSVDGALDDLAAGRLRVLHPASFRDDPTRLWRLVRYAVRLDFLPESVTDGLAAAAVAGGAPATVSGDRLGNELRLALRERAPLSVLHAAQALGLVARLDLDPERAARAVDLAPPEARRDLVLLGSVVPDARWASGMGFTAAEERILARAASLEPLMPDRPSAVVEALRGEPAEAVAVAGARGDAETARRYLGDWRHVRLDINGKDLVAAGIPEGPEVGERLRRVLARRLDGELGGGRDAELAAALA